MDALQRIKQKVDENPITRIAGAECLWRALRIREHL